MTVCRAVLHRSRSRCLTAASATVAGASDTKLAEATGKAARAALETQRQHVARSWHATPAASHERLPPTAHVVAEQVFEISVPGRIRNRDPLLKKYPWKVAGRRPTSPYEASNWTNHLGVSSCVARRLSRVAP